MWFKSIRACTIFDDILFLFLIYWLITAYALIISARYFRKSRLPHRAC